MIDYPRIYLYKRIVQAKIFIDSHYSDKIDLDNIADEACFSKYHFIRQFSKIYGKTPHQYLISVRLNKAVELFSKGCSVSDTCFAVGFESISTFSGLFKKSKGISPSFFLAGQRERNKLIVNFPLNFVPGCHSEKRIMLKEQF